MAKVIIDNQEFEVADNSKFVTQAESAGVPFGCAEGICGSCLCKVESGSENLNPKTQEEQDMDLKDNERLLCQCQIKSGIVKFKYW